MQKEAILKAGQRLEDHPEFIHLEEVERMKKEPQTEEKNEEDEREELFFITEDVIEEQKV